MYDLSFIYTMRCDLECPFCMYNSSPASIGSINLSSLAGWLKTVDMGRIASFGVYGGEVSVDYVGFGACLDLVAKWDLPRFVITNGTWSTSSRKTWEFLHFVNQYGLYVVVSGTPEHRRYQDRKVLETLQAKYPEAIRLKSLEENYHAMGRLAGKMLFSCSQKCMSWKRALRLATQPNGTIIFQNCDGVYPVVGNLSESFSEIDTRVQGMRETGFSVCCPYYAR
jgi:hypothetical protein